MGEAVSDPSGSLHFRHPADRVPEAGLSVQHVDPDGVTAAHQLGRDVNAHVRGGDLQVPLCFQPGDGRGLQVTLDDLCDDVGVSDALAKEVEAGGKPIRAEPLKDG